MTHGVTIKGLEVQVLICDANVARVGHQWRHHLSLALHVWPLRHTLKATHTKSHYIDISQHTMLYSDSIQ